MAQTKPIVSIENVVASASVDQAIDLKDVTKKFPETEWHPDQFPGLVFRLQSPKTATLIFRSGKMVCTGGKSEAFSIKEVQPVSICRRKLHSSNFITPGSSLAALRKTTEDSGKYLAVTVSYVNRMFTDFCY